MVFLDTLGYFATFDENDASEWKQRVMTPLRGLVAKHGCSFMLVHHLNKDSKAAGWKKGRGTAAMFGDVDAYIRLDQAKPEEPYVMMYVDKNKYAPVMSIPLTFDGVNAVFELATEG
jgi:RecA-family ATPase